MAFTKTLLLSSLLCALPWTMALASSQSQTSEGTETYEYEPPPTKPTGAKPSILLKGELNYVVPRGTPLKLQLATVPTHALHLLDRDLDGNLLPAKVGDEVTAKVAEDLYVDDNKVIPAGTIFHGSVSHINPPRRVGRPGSLVISFDQLTTPDGRKFAFRAEADNFKPSTAKSKAKGFGLVMAHAAGGAAVGAIIAYQIFGLHSTVAMHGYNIAGGAAAGALLATGYALMRHGSVARLEPGDDLNMQIDSDLLMPAAAERQVKTSFANLPGLKVEIEKGRIVGDGLDGYVLIVDATVKNESEHRLSSIDIFLEDSNGNRAPLTSAPDNEDLEMLFTIEPHTSHHIHLAFAVEYPKLKRHLIWLNHDTHAICYKEKLP